MATSHEAERKEVMSGQVQGATSGTPGHMAEEGAKALGCIWGTNALFQTQRSGTRGAPSCGSAGLRSLAVPRHGRQRQRLEHRGSREESRSPAPQTVRETDFSMGKHKAGAQQESRTPSAWPTARKGARPSRGDPTPPGSRSSLQRHGEGLAETPQRFPRAPAGTEAQEFNFLPNAKPP